jgi:hypothetical protein
VRSTNRLVTMLLLLVCVMIVGMLTSSWRVVLYPYLAMIGVVILLGIGTRIKEDYRFAALGVGVSVAYVVLYLWLDVVAGSDPGASTNLIGGLVPSTAIYFFVIWPFGLFVALLYSVYHRWDLSDERVDEELS